jgi:hypothetical protein
MNPFVFIVGCPRSGTTLLQRILDCHPQVAITPETHWIPRWYEKKKGKGITADGFVRRKLVRKLFTFPRFTELGIDRAEIEPLIKPRGTVSYSRFISALFDLYGKKRGKLLVGDKTPGYARNLNTLHALWPAAKFVHLIRDGRDVCLSVLSWQRARGWKASQGAARFSVWAESPLCAAALWWDWHVRLAREAGRVFAPGVYAEVRYEDLVADPPAECRKLCNLLDIPYEDSMLGLYECRAREGAAGDQKHLWRPITAGLRDWRAQMPSEDVELFEAAAGELLDELGYPRLILAPGSETLHYARAARERCAQEAQSHRYAVPVRW